MTISHQLSMKSIAEQIAHKHRLDFPLMFNPCKSRTFSWPRQEAMTIMKAAGFSYKQISNFFKLKNHTTVVRGVEAFKRRLEIDCAEVDSHVHR